MKRSIAILVGILAGTLAVACGPRGGETTTPTVAGAGRAPVAPVPIAEYFHIARVAGAASFSHDESLVAYVTDVGGRMDVWVRPTAGGEARQVTHVDGFVLGFGFSPTDDVLLVEADHGGDELGHLFLTDAEGSTWQELMPGDPEGTKTSFLRWADDGQSFLYLSNRRDVQFMDLYEYTPATGSSERLWESSGVLNFAGTSRDHRTFVIVEVLSDVNSNMYLFPRGAPAPELLTPHEGDVLYAPTTFTQDGGALFYTSDEGREFTALLAMDLETKASRAVLEEEWDVEVADFSRAWTYFYTSTNVDGEPRVVLTRAGAEEPVALPDLGAPGALVPLEFSSSDRLMAATLVSDTAPTELYVIDLEAGTATRLTESLPESLRARPMVTGESVRVPSFDGREVPAFVYRPAGEGPFPAVIDVHGGPTAQSRRKFDRMRQYLVSKGWVVLVPNVRGSTGYGKTYTKLDNLDLGGGPLQDVVACKRWMVEHAGVSADRVVVLGGSYGGYMALAAAAFTPGEFAAQVDYFGVSELKSLVESFPPYWMAMATYIYEKFGDPANPAHAQYQHDRSPLYFVDRIVTPLLVVQGENDVRVRRDQSDRIVEALRERGVPVHYLILEREGHGFSRNESMLAAYELTDRFLDRYIFGDASVALP
ncbi:MAG: S9 family peptidase [Deltaproteobacteria bacterium]|nr:S9 family peptidase [Deltaproteobacteria bacterium]